MKKVFLGLMLSALAACTDPQGTQQALKGVNLTPVEIGGYSFFGCAGDDWFHTRFTAQNEKGETITGVVCRDFFKDSTVRFK